MAKDAILQVHTAFQATVDGGLVLFSPGKLYLEDDPIVRKYPQYFRPAVINSTVKRVTEPPAPVIEQATSAPGEKRGR
jgi:hypothetical protein